MQSTLACHYVDWTRDIITQRCLGQRKLKGVRFRVRCT